MSIALRRNMGLDPSSSGFSPRIGGQGSVFGSPEFGPGNRSPVAEEEEEVTPAASTSSESSSIGKNSDASSGGDRGQEEEENEVQSSYRGPLDMMDALEEVLPRRRSISNFYDGKSKSYMNLAAATCSSNVNEIAKPENAYSRRRRNLLAFHLIWDKNHSSTLKGNAGGISKRPLSSSKSTLALAVAMSSSESYSSTSEDSSSSSVSLSRSPPPLPPLHPPPVKSSHGQISSPRLKSSPWKSYSVADLQHCANPLARLRFKDPIDEKADLEQLT